MATRGAAVVLHGAAADRPDEADTIVQAEAVASALSRLGWLSEIRILGASADGLDHLLRPRPDLLFNLVEAIGGDGAPAHLVPQALERRGIRFTGAPARALYLTTRKPLAKAMMRAARLPTPDWLEAGGPAPAGGRYIVKSATEDASLGIDAGSVVPAERVAAEIAARAARFGGDWFAEAYVEGRELNVGLLEAGGRLEVLPIAEIDFLGFPADRPRIVDYEAKWQQDSFAYGHTPRRFDIAAADAALLRRLGRLACRAFRLFGLAGYGRVDFRVDAAGRPWILEVNANPCLAEDAGFMAAAAHAGLDFDRVVARIADGALAARRPARPTASRFAPLPDPQPRRPGPAPALAAHDPRSGPRAGPRSGPRSGPRADPGADPGAGPGTDPRAEQS